MRERLVKKERINNSIHSLEKGMLGLEGAVGALELGVRRSGTKINGVAIRTVVHVAR
jgi:hypothetical protein